MNIRMLTAVAGATLVVACAEPAGLSPEQAGPLLHRSHEDARPITALTQNLYIGADVDGVIGALASPDPADDVPALLAAVQTVGETAYPARAGAIAGAIARSRPHAIGLQEVTQLDIDLAALGLPIAIHQDFLAILGDSLAARGLHYVVAVKVKNTVAQPIPGIGLVDYDAILVDADRVTVTSTASGNFSLNIGVVAPGVEIKRGWTLVRARIGDDSYVFVNTHLESGDGPGLAQLRAAQATELTALTPTDAPVFLMGDLNDVPGSLMHQVLSASGFVDAWAELRPRSHGFTCCQTANLANAASVHTRRFDYVMVRLLERRHHLHGETHRIGAHPRERIDGPAHSIWPSDHAGVVLKLQ